MILTIILSRPLLISISRERERDRKNHNSGLNTQTDTNTEKRQSDLLGSLQEPKISSLNQSLRTTTLVTLGSSWVLGSFWDHLIFGQSKIVMEWGGILGGFDLIFGKG